MASKVRIAIAVSVGIACCACSSVKRDWEYARTKNTIPAYENFLSEHPESEFASTAEHQVRVLREYQESSARPQHVRRAASSSSVRERGTEEDRPPPGDTTTAGTLQRLRETGSGEGVLYEGSEGDFYGLAWLSRDELRFSVDTPTKQAVVFAGRVVATYDKVQVLSMLTGEVTDGGDAAVHRAQDGLEAKLESVSKTQVGGFQPDGSQMRTVEETTTVSVRRGSGVWHEVASFPGDAGQVAWSPDAALLALRADRSVVVLRPSGQEARRFSKPHEEYLRPSFGRGSAKVYFIARANSPNRSRVVEGDVRSGAVRELIDWPGLVDFAVSPDARTLALVAEKKGVFELSAMDTDSRRVVSLSTESSSDAYPLFSQDGKMLVFSRAKKGPSCIFGIGYLGLRAKLDALKPQGGSAAEAGEQEAAE